MRLAILSVTHNGALLAKRLASSLKAEIDIFAKIGNNPIGAKEYEHLGQLVATLFHQYDSLVFILPVGIVVRIIAPHVRDKRYDPAVVALDEQCSYAISLLSGHLGGANSLARRVGEAVGAHSVITTVSDISKKPSVDLLSVKLNLAIEPFEQLKEMNTALLNSEKVSFFLDSSMDNSLTYISAAEELDVDLIDMKELADTENYDAAVVITDKELYMVKPYIFLRPTTLVVGLGCKPGTTSSEILAAITDACKKAGRSMKCIAVIASSAVKEDEIGILAAAQQLEIPVRFFTASELQQGNNRCGLHANIAADESIGAGNVCEAAALLAGKSDSLVLGTTKYTNVTVAIAEAKPRWWE